MQPVAQSEAPAPSLAAASLEASLSDAGLPLERLQAYAKALKKAGIEENAATVMPDKAHRNTNIHLSVGRAFISFQVRMFDSNELSMRIFCFD